MGTAHTKEIQSDIENKNEDLNKRKNIRRIQDGIREVFLSRSSENDVKKLKEIIKHTKEGEKLENNTWNKFWSLVQSASNIVCLNKRLQLAKSNEMHLLFTLIKN